MSKLREFRERLFLSQGELADKAGVTKATVNRLEKELHKPTYRTIRKLAAALGVEQGEIEF